MTVCTDLSKFRRTAFSKSLKYINSAHVRSERDSILIDRGYYVETEEYKDNIRLNKGCTNPGGRIVLATEFCNVAPNVCGSSVWNLFHVTRMLSRILR
jgi:hypothetical protein